MADKIQNVGAYTRLSRDDGDKAESESIGSQKEIIRDFIQNKKDMVIIKEYVDDGYSGVSFAGVRQRYFLHLPCCGGHG